MSLKALLTLLVLPLLAGCHERKTGGPLSAAQAAAVREHAAQSERNDAVAQAGVAKEAMPTPAPEAAPVKAKVLETDPRGCTWIESAGLVTVGEDESRHQVRASAVNEARRVAMQDFLGVSVRARKLDFQQEGLKDQKQITESMLLTTRQGRILDEKVASEGYQDLADCKGCRYGVTLRSCILPTPDYADKEFQVDLGISRNKLVDGDAVTLNVTCSRECWVYAYDLWLDWQKTSLIVPNDRLPAVHLMPSQTWEYPDDAARSAGVSMLQATLPEGYTVSAETVRVVATKSPMPAKVVDPSQGFLAVLRRLNAQRVDWAEDAQAFTIYKK